eukprot:4523410-Pyramimonas_sp.AAC.1
MASRRRGTPGPPAAASSKARPVRKAPTRPSSAARPRPCPLETSQMGSGAMGRRIAPRRRCIEDASPMHRRCVGDVGDAWAIGVEIAALLIDLHRRCIGDAPRSSDPASPARAPSRRPRSSWPAAAACAARTTVHWDATEASVRKHNTLRRSEVSPTLANFASNSSAGVQIAAQATFARSSKSFSFCSWPSAAAVEGSETVSAHNCMRSATLFESAANFSRGSRTPASSASVAMGRSLPRQSWTRWSPRSFAITGSFTRWSWSRSLNV